MPAPAGITSNKMSTLDGSTQRGLNPIIKSGISDAKTANTAELASEINKIGNTVQNMWGQYLNVVSSGAAMANAESARAQQKQYEYNLDLMEKQNAQQQNYLEQMKTFNTSSAAEANRITAELFEKAMKYNKEEAEKNRAWQKEMSATAYQRTMEDMKAAGLNPILAAQNGATAFGSGGQASIGSGSGTSAAGVNANAASGSVGSYSGQGPNISDRIALLGTGLELLGTFLGSAKQNSTITKIVEDVEDVIEDGKNKMEHNDTNYTGNSEARYVGLWKLGYFFDSLRQKLSK